MTSVPVTVQERLPLAPAMPRRPAAAGGPGSMTFADVIRILKQRLFLILFVFLTASAATAGLTLYLQKYHELFRADAMVLVESEGIRKPMEFGGPAIAVEMLNRWLANQQQYLTQDRVLDAAFKDPAIRATGWYRDWIQQGKDAESLYEKLKTDLNVSPIPNTSYLLVRFEARKREDAETIVNTILRTYTESLAQDSMTNLKRQLDEYTKQLKSLEQALESNRTNRENFIAQLIKTPGEMRGIHVQAEQWRALALEKMRVEAEQIQLKANWDNLKNLSPSQMAINPTLKINIQQDSQVIALSNALTTLETEYHSALGRVGPEHRMIKGLQSEIQAAQELRDQIIRQKEDEIRQFQMVSAETAWLNALQAQDALDERVTEFKAEEHDLDNKVAQVSKMEEDRDLLRKQYDSLSEYVQSLRLLVSSEETVHVRAGLAVAPPKRSFPRWELNMPVGSFLGLLIGVGLALLLELGSTSIRTPRDLLRHIHIPILGTVPDLDDEEVAIERIELASHAAPRSMVAEAFRTIRTNLLLSSPAERQRTVLITSSRPEEGKTTVAVNLATAIGQSGRRVLLVDANFHRPTLHALFPKAHREGLSNILIGRGRLEDLVSPTELPNLDVLTCGPIPPNPTELLSSRYLAELIAQAAGRYDQVLFDGPPVLLVSDALVLASAVDGVITVCRARATSRGTVQRAREQLERVNARIFGAVLNAAQVARGGYFREQMRSYYDYQPEEALLTGTTRALPPDSGTDGK